MSPRDALADLRSFLGRSTVIELLVAFALAAATVGFVSSVVNDLILTPIIEPAAPLQSIGPLDFVIRGRAFATEHILTSGVALGLLVLLAAFMVHAHAGELWEDEGDSVKCPHCLTEIPAGARVCAACTRDISA